MAPHPPHVPPQESLAVSPPDLQPARLLLRNGSLALPAAARALVERLEVTAQGSVCGPPLLDDVGWIVASGLGPTALCLDPRLFGSNVHSILND